MASPAINEIFEYAMIKFREELSAKELRHITTPTDLPDVLKVAENALNNWSSGTHPIRIKAFERLQKARSHLEPFDSILEGLTGLAPVGSKLIWSSVKTVFEFVENSNEGFNQVFDFFTSMAEEIPLIDSLSTTFRNSALLKPAVKELVEAIMKFWIEAVKHYRARPGAAFRRFVKPKAISKKFEDLRSELQRQKDRLWRSAEAQHYSDTSEHHQQSFEQVASAILKWISAPSYNADHKKACKKHYGDTCKWITRKEEYRTWSATGTGALLVIYGVPGAGKTILSSFLVRDIASSGSPGSSSTGSIILYHYFKYNDDTKNTSMAAVRSMLEQLYNQFWTGTCAIDLSERFQNLAQRRCDSFDDWWEIFQSLIVSDNAAVTIVLDALDECKDAKTLAKELLRITSATAVKVVLTARKEWRYVELFAESTSTLVIEISQTDVEHDITAFVEYKIKKTERLTGQENEKLRSRLLAKLCDPKSHQGMFLWVYLMCKDVKDRLAFSDGPEVIKEFPAGLDSVYEAILDKLNRLSETQQEFCRLILTWVVCSSRPLLFAELEHALKLSQRSSTAYFEKVEGDKYQLCFSRKDIVRVCGSLVSYTGLADGDNIGLIHLTARDFLSRASGKGDVRVHLSSFGVNVPNSKALLCSTCLDSLLDRSLHADPYFEGRENLVHQPKAQDKAFKQRHPLFEYAVRYWPELAWEALTSQLENDNIVNLTHKIAAFTENDFSVFWTESFFSQYGPEFCVFNVKRFRRLSSLLSKALPWVNSVLYTLKTYKTSIYHDSRVILNSANTQTLARRNVNEFRKTQALVQVGLPAQSPQHQSDLPIPLTGWAHYDVRTDSLYHVPCDPRRKKLNRWIIGEELKFRPALHTEMSDSDSFWNLSSAVLSPCGQYIAVTYAFLGRSLQTVVWKIDAQSERTAAADWAELCLVDRHDIVPERDLYYTRMLRSDHEILSFGKENTLNAPGCIWNIVSREKVSRPTAIYEPEASLEVSSTCFGMDRVARLLHRTELEILDMHGKSLLRHEFRMHHAAVEIVLGKFSSSSRKLTVYHVSQDGEGIMGEALYCFLLGKKVLVKLQMPQRRFTPFPQVKNPKVQFADNENKIVTTFEDTDEANFSILVYALPNGIGSNSYDELPGTCIFRAMRSDIALCIQQPVTAETPSLLLYTQNIGLQKRALDQEWTETEDRQLRDVTASETMKARTRWYPIKQGTQWLSIHSPSPHGRGTIPPTGKGLLTVSTWHCGQQLELKGTVTTELHSLDYVPDNPIPPKFSVSCNGKYIATEHSLFHLNRNSLTLVDLHLADDLRAYSFDFSQDETRFAVTCLDKTSNKYNLFVFELFRDLTTRLLAKEPCQGEAFSVAFHTSNSSFLIVSSRDGNRSNIRIAKVGALKSEWMELWSGLVEVWSLNARFSSCGKYVTVKGDEEGYYEGYYWPKFKAPHDAVLEQGTANHPYMFVGREICSPDMYRLRVDDGSRVAYLEHKLLDSADHDYRVRVLCVVPDDGALWIWRLPTLIWPPDDADDDEVKYTESGHDLIVRTGIRSRDLLHGAEWIAAKDLYANDFPERTSNNDSDNSYSDDNGSHENDSDVSFSSTQNSS